MFPISMKTVSQKAIVEMKRVFGSLSNHYLSYGDLLYERDFQDWFVIHAQSYSWDWTAILIELRRGTFFFNVDITGFQQCIVSSRPLLTLDEARVLGEGYIQKLAAFATTLPESEALQRSLQLDGFDIDKERLRLMPLEGAVSARQEEDNLTRLVKATGLPNVATILKHIEDSHSLYAEG
jgi:hypothetical protein